jgi:hypothetical protein
MKNDNDNGGGHLVTARCHVLDCEGCVAEVEIGPGQKIVTLIAGAKADILAEVMPGNYLTRARDLTHGLARPPFPIILCVCSDADARFLAGLSVDDAAVVAWRVLRCKARADGDGPTLH